MHIRRKPRPGEMLKHLAHSLFSAGLGAYDPGRYRSTPSGAPDVAKLVRPGMMIHTSYGTGGIVTKIEGPPLHVTAGGREYPHFTIVYVPAGRLSRHTTLDRNWINECVAVNGRILMLLEADTDEVFIDGGASGLP